MKIAQLIPADGRFKAKVGKPGAWIFCPIVAWALVKSDEDKDVDEVKPVVIDEKQICVPPTIYQIVPKDDMELH